MRKIFRYCRKYLCCDSAGVCCIKTAGGMFNSRLSAAHLFFTLSFSHTTSEIFPALDLQTTASQKLEQGDEWWYGYGLDFFTMAIFHESVISMLIAHTHQLTCSCAAWRECPCPSLDTLKTDATSKINMASSRGASKGSLSHTTTTPHYTQPGLHKLGTAQTVS